MVFSGEVWEAVEKKFGGLDLEAASRRDFNTREIGRPSSARKRVIDDEKLYQHNDISCFGISSGAD